MEANATGAMGTAPTSLSGEADSVAAAADSAAVWVEEAWGADSEDLAEEDSAAAAQEADGKPVR